MRLPFRRRRISDPMTDGSGLVMEWVIPYDTADKDDEDALVRHIRRFSRLDPITFVRLMSSPLGSLIFGRFRIKGPPIGRDSLGSFDDLVPAKPGSLSEEEYEREMFGQSPLQWRVYQRLKTE